MTKPQPFSAGIRNVNDASVMDLHGELDSFAEADLQAAYDQVESVNPCLVIMNFRDVGYINSTGIALIVNLLSRARKANRKIAVFGLSDHYVTIFQITRLTDFLSIFTDEASALASVSAAGD